VFTPSKKRSQTKTVDIDELPLVVLKKLKGDQFIQSNLKLMEQVAISLTLLQFATPHLGLSSQDSDAVSATSPVSVLPLLSCSQGLSSTQEITPIYSPYDAAPIAMTIDMEASLSPIRKYYRSVRSSAMILHGQHGPTST
jgi:hypothetical protein